MTRCDTCNEPRDSWCGHGGNHCADADCVRRCVWCEADLADARDDLDRLHELERY